MSLTPQQIERWLTNKLLGGRYNRYSNKENKKAQHRKQRRKMKADINYVPQYNRYDGWEW